MKAINTFYKGYYFRSRLEARWAVFFDVLGWKWEYEKEGYELSSGERYLPDFYFPDKDIFAEIKPKNEAFEKSKTFSREIKKSIFLLFGVPDFRVYNCFGDWDDGQELRECPVILEYEKYGVYWAPGFENKDGTIDIDYFKYSLLFINAVHTARSARFEFGQTPVICQ